MLSVYLYLMFIKIAVMKLGTLLFFVGIGLNAQDVKVKSVLEMNKESFEIRLNQSEVDQINWKQLKRNFSHVKRNDSIQITIKLDDVNANQLKEIKTYSVKGMKKNRNSLIHLLQNMVEGK